MKTTIHNQYSFLNAKGEMAERTRNFDWTQTSLGSPDKWPQSLRTTLSIILSSRFPMFLWWGEEFIQFYNDAYRPSLGNDGKHPKALGQNGEECWPEIWSIIYPLIKQVREKGEATWSEDQLIPIYRNGKIEDVYWTFGYSPVYGETGNVQGVLVVCHETTEKMKTQAQLKESESRFRNMADNIPNLAWMADAKGSVYWYNKKWFDYTGTTPEQMREDGWESIHDPEILPRVIENWNLSLSTGKPFEMIFPLKGADKKYRKFLTRVVPMKNEVGEIYQWFGTNTDITEQLRVEQSLIESEERFRTMAEDTNIYIATSDETSKAVYFNESWIHLTGRPYEQLLDYGWVDLVHPEDRNHFVNLYTSAFQKKESWKAEFRVLAKSGDYHWLFSTGNKRTRADGSFAGFISSSVDITDRKKAEDKLKESEERLRSVIESAPFPIGVYVGREMRIAMLNQSIMDVWGKGGDLIGKTYSEVLPELEEQNIYQQLDKVYTTGKAFHARNQRVDLVVNGKLLPFYFNYSFTPLFDSQGQVYGVINTAADVTDLNFAKQKVEQSEKNLRNMVLQAPVAMCILTGHDYIIEVANELVIEIWRKTREQVLNKPLLEALPEVKNQGIKELLDNVRDTGIPFVAKELPVQLERKGKTETAYLNFAYEPYRDGDGQIIGILAVATEVTDQVIARQKIEDIVTARTKELAEANTNLQKSNKELAQFAYIASHDLQEPLRKISTFSQMLESSLEGKIEEHSRNYLLKIISSTARMNVLIKDVLKYSELEKAGSLFETVNLNAVIDSIKADYDLLIEQKNASIECEPLPTIEAIPAQMSQLFGNLIGNSLKFVRKNQKPLIEINIGKIDKNELSGNVNFKEDREYIKIVVKDNGIGFNAEYADNIFNIFQRLHRKSEYEGTGIGLAMCKKIAVNHHGDINAKGSSENGAVFNVILPLRQKT